MSVEHEKLKEILAEAPSQETAKTRAAYPDAVCRCDTALRQQVEGLLAAHYQSPACAAMLARWPNQNEL